MENLHSINFMKIGQNVFCFCPQGAGLAAANTCQVSLILICIKLTTVMGLTWILTLIANWQQAAFLQYPATVINSMQGTSNHFLYQINYRLKKVMHSFQSRYTANIVHE